MNTNDIQNSLRSEKPPKKLVRLAFLFNLSLGILLLGTLLLGGCSSTMSGTLSWQGTQGLPSELVSAALSNTSLSSDKLNLQVASIPTSDLGHLYLFNYNAPALCGKLGCLYVAYLDDGKHHYRKVLSAYLHQGLPAGEKSISVSNSVSGSRLPCFDLRQVHANLLDLVTYCFDGNAYHPVKQVEQKLK